MTKVFISYTRRNDYDKQFAETVRSWLLNDGFDVWMDVHDIPSGAHWDTEIDNALQSCDVVLGLVSPESVNSDNVKNEWAWALQRDKLQLALLADCDIPHRFVRIDYIDFRKQNPDSWRRLHDALTQAGPRNTFRTSPSSGNDPLQGIVQSIGSIFSGGAKPKLPAPVKSGGGWTSNRTLLIFLALAVCGCISITVLNAIGEAMVTNCLYFGIC
ncbi:MAG: toll/interleukin-1 receptor domain-containing protein [Anaerolineaceae bacterium]|nr:toll/interleukin-1 receptor domain-containing protein [Anaerolineaceae bacterium]